MLGSVVGPDAATVFIEHHIAHPVELVFDAPMAAIQREQLLGIDLITAQRRDAVDDFRRGLRLAGLPLARSPTAGDAEGLLHPRPTQLPFEEPVQRDGAFQRPVFATAVALV